jgi:hypothetical protein
MVELRIEGRYNSSCEVLGHLKQAQETTVVTKLLFSEVDFDERLVQALEELFSKTCAAAAAKKERKWERVHFPRCSGPIFNLGCQFVAGRIQCFRISHFSTMTTSPPCFTSVPCWPIRI